MYERIVQTRKGQYCQLLATVSALSLLGTAYMQNTALAEDVTDRPTVWIELGGQLERIDSGQQIFMAPFFKPPASFVTISPSESQRLPRYGLGEEGKITFQPGESGWVLSAGIRYGHSNGKRKEHQQTYSTQIPYTFQGHQGYVPQRVNKFADASAQYRENHAVLDFQAGKDFGIGMFGLHGASTFSFGVRAAQFARQSAVSMGELPDPFKMKYLPQIPASIPVQNPHSFLATENGSTRFQGIGPSLALNASEAVAGTPQTGAITFDWGLNGAVLFGRQKAQTQHRTTEYYKPYSSSFAQTLYQHPTHHTRVKSVIVPNVGGFVGATFRYSNAKLSLGYRADFFFGAIDGGIDATKKENIGFYGPFASISVGIGG